MQHETHDETGPLGVVKLILKPASQIKEWDMKYKFTSDPVIIRNMPWRILLMIRDNDTCRKYLGYYLQCNPTHIVTNWTCRARSDLKLICQGCEADNIVKRVDHIYHSKENDWGYSSYVDIGELFNPKNGYLGPDDSLVFQADVFADAPHGANWNSKKITGFVGLKNQGATCYMNSLLQVLFFTNKLRHAIYQMKMEEEDEKHRSLGLALQRLFFDLQYSTEAVGTKKLTRSFGWDNVDSFMQHDIQELCRVLLDNMETKMKGTPLEMTIPGLFRGEMLSYIRCKKVNFESTRKEYFYDIQLKIKGNSNVHDAFREYVATETLDGDNKYDAGVYGLQEAEKGVKFIHFPPLLYLQLLRFQYDFEKDSNIKINDQFEFSYELNLDEYLVEPKSTPTLYFLHAVLVHSGDNHFGHYVAYINPCGDGKWYKFDDDVVSSCSHTEAIDMNFGGRSQEQFLMASSTSNAYMLVYMSKERQQDILAQHDSCEIPETYRSRFEADLRQRELKRKERSQAHLYSSVYIITDEDMKPVTGSYDIYNMAATARLRYCKDCEFAEYIQLLAEKVSANPNDVRPWFFCTNIREFPPIQLYPMNEMNFRRQQPDRIYLERLRPAPRPFQASATSLPLYKSLVSDERLLFVKFYDVKSKSLQHLDSLTVSLKIPLWKYLETMKHPVKSVADALFYFESDVLLRVDVNNSSRLDDLLHSCDLDPNVHGHVLVFQQRPTSATVPLTTSYRSKNQNIISRTSGIGGGGSGSIEKSLSSTTPKSDQALWPLHAHFAYAHDYYVLSQFCVRAVFFDREEFSQLKDLSGGGGGGSGAITTPLTSTGNIFATADQKPHTPSSLPNSPSHPGNVIEIRTEEQFRKFGGISIALSTRMNYTQFAEHVSRELKHNLSQCHSASYLQFYIINCSESAIASSMRTSMEALLKQTKSSNTFKICGKTVLFEHPDYPLSTHPVHFCYQRLQKPIETMESMKNFKLTLFMKSNEELEMDISVRQNDARVLDVLKDACQKLNYDADDAVEHLLRLVCICSHRIVEIYKPDKLLSTLSLPSELEALHLQGIKYLRLDEVADKEKNCIDLPVAHFHEKPTHCFGTPFILLVDYSESVEQVLGGVQDRLKVSSIEFNKWKFFFITNSQIIVLDLDDKRNFATDIFSRHMKSFCWLGLDHRNPDKRNMEKAIKIHN